MQAEADKNAKLEQDIDRGFEHLEKIGVKLNQSAKNAVYTQIVKSSNPNVLEAYLEIKDSIDKTAKIAQQKSEGFIPPSQKGSEATPTFEYKSIHGKSLMELLRERGQI